MFAKGRLKINRTHDAIVPFVISRSLPHYPLFIRGRFIREHLGDGIEQRVDRRTVLEGEGRQMRREVSNKPASNAHGLVKESLVLKGCIRSCWRDERTEVKRRQGNLTHGRSLPLPGSNKAGTEVEQQASGTAGGSSGTGHGERIDNLGRCGGGFRINVVEKGKHIAEEGIGVMVGQPGMEPVEGGMVGSGTKQW
jgi:hypothetical protein